MHKYKITINGNQPRIVEAHNKNQFLEEVEAKQKYFKLITMPMGETTLVIIKERKEI